MVRFEVYDTLCDETLTFGTAKGLSKFTRVKTDDLPKPGEPEKAFTRHGGEPVASPGPDEDFWMVKAL